jgi:hypothetical protein
MNIINKGANSYLYFTLNEKKTLTTPYYLFVFTNDITDESVTFTCLDLSDYKYRYNKFLITETSGTNNYTSGVITLNPSGFWSYKIYEMSTSTNLIVANTTSLVEEGKIKVVGTTDVKAVFTPTRTYKTYDGV